MPYEAAQGRVLLAQAQIEDGRASAACIELESARSTFERLGAAMDLAVADAQLQR